MVLRRGLFRKHKGLTSVIVTVFITFMLIFSGPASAIKVTLVGVDDIDEGKSLTFDLTVKMEYEDERVPIGNVTVVLQDDSGVTVGKYAFALDGTSLTPGIDATMMMSDVDYGYGNMVGHENCKKYQFGYGYGYGYGYGMGSHSLMYSINITDAQNLPGGNYSVRVKLETGSTVKPSFNSHKAEFTIRSTTAQDVTPPIIKIVNPVDGSIIGPFNDFVLGGVVDDVGISNVTLSVNGELQYSWTHAGAFGRRVDYDIRQWNTINVTATDTSGNVNSEEISVYVRSPRHFCDLRRSPMGIRINDFKNQNGDSSIEMQQLNWNRQYLLYFGMWRRICDRLDE